MEIETRIFPIKNERRSESEARTRWKTLFWKFHLPILAYEIALRNHPQIAQMINPRLNEFASSNKLKTQMNKEQI